MPLSPRHVAQFGMRGEEDRRWKFRRHVVGQIEVDIEAAQVALLQPVDRLDLFRREYLAAGGVLHMRQRLEAFGQEIASADLFRRHGRQGLPGNA